MRSASEQLNHPLSNSARPTRSRVFLFSEMYYPEETSTGYLLTHLMESLSKHWDISVITGPATNHLQPVNHPARETVNNVSIIRNMGSTFNKNVLLGRIANIVTRSITLFASGLRQVSRGSILFVVTNPPTLPFMAALIARIRGATLLVLVHDLYPDALAATGALKESSPAYKLLRWLTRVMFRSATAVVVLGRDTAHHLMTVYRVPENRISVIPNWAEHGLIQPTPRKSSKLLAELGLLDKFVVLYAGNLGRTHGVEQLAAAAQSLKVAPSIHFLVIGDGHKRRWLERFAESSQLGNMTILPTRPRSEQSEFLAACDVAVILLVSNMRAVSVPSRLYSHMAAGRPIIAACEPRSELQQVIEEEQIGWVIEPENGEALAATILRAAQSTAQLHAMGQRAYEASLKKYALPGIASAYDQLFAKLLTHSQS